MGKSIASFPFSHFSLGETLKELVWFIKLLKSIKNESTYFQFHFEAILKIFHRYVSQACLMHIFTNLSCKSSTKKFFYNMYCVVHFNIYDAKFWSFYKLVTRGSFIKSVHRILIADFLRFKSTVLGTTDNTEVQRCGKFYNLVITFWIKSTSSGRM